MAGRRVFCSILSILISFNFLFIPFFSTNSVAIDIKESEKKRQELQSESTRLKKVLSETKNKIDEKSKYIKAVDSQITVVSKQIKLTNDRIASLDNEVKSKEKEIKSIQDNIEENLDVLEKRIKAVYTAYEPSILDIALMASNFDDFVDKMEVINRLGLHDERLVNTLKSQIISLDDDKKIIEKNKIKVVNEEKELSSKQNELDILQKENQKALEELNGEKDKAQSCLDENDAEYKRIQFKIEQYYVEQAKKKSSPGGASKLSKNNVVPSGKRYLWPVPGYSRLSSVFNEKRGNKYHKGIDIAGAGIYGKPVVAPDNGVVISMYNGCSHDFGKNYSCGCAGGYGNYVCLDHGNGRCTLGAHLSKVNVKLGQYINRGDIIGYVGTTGHSTGPHFHYECRRFNQKYDPMSEYNN